MHAEGTRAMKEHNLYRCAWYTVSGALVLAIAMVLYSIGWEYSTRRYLKGFSDAIVPLSAPPEDKVQAILTWMAHGPARQTAGPDGSTPDRDPTETLNYNALLKVCGSATNAFINLGDSAGIEVRRLLLLDSRRFAKHVSAEVLVGGRWIVVDPAFRVILRGPDGMLLTREQLKDPAIFVAATRNIRGYNPNYNYDLTAHIRLGRVRLASRPLRAVLNSVLPGWEDSVTVSLLAERESFAFMLVSICLLVFLALLRASLRWYGEKRLGVHTLRMREQIRRAFGAFVNTVG
jgi:hypothetical protein